MTRTLQWFQRIFWHVVHRSSSNFSHLLATCLIQSPPPPPHPTVGLSALMAARSGWLKQVPVNASTSHSGTSHIGPSGTPQHVSPVASSMPPWPRWARWISAKRRRSCADRSLEWRIDIVTCIRRSATPWEYDFTWSPAKIRQRIRVQLLAFSSTMKVNAAITLLLMFFSYLWWWPL